MTGLAQCKSGGARPRVSKYSKLLPRLISALLASLALMAAFAASAGAVAPADFYGTITFNQLASDEEAAELQRLGIHNLQMNINWREFETSNCNDEPEEAGVHFSSFDKKVRRAAEHDITIVAGLYGTRVPAGCPNGTDLHQFPVSGTKLYKDYVFQEGGGFGGGFIWQVVQRYGVNGSFWYANPDLTPHPIRVWNVWNEMNFGENNPFNTIQPQMYAKFLIDTSAAIRKAQEKLVGQNPYNVGTRVLFGGLWGDTEYAQGGTVAWTLTKYLNAVYNSPMGYTATQLHNAIDGFSYHPYALHGNAIDVENRVNSARTVLNSFGDGNKTLWLTEIGWPVGFNQISPSHNAQEQSDLLATSLSWIWNNREYLKAEYAAVFAYQDYAGQGSCTSGANCWPLFAGIRDVNGKERPAWCKLASFIGSFACSPETGAAAVQVGTTTNVYTRGGNGHLYQKACCFGSEGWTSWWDMGAPPGGIVTSSPAAVQAGSATNVYVRGSNNHLYQKACCFGSEGWTSWWDMGAPPGGIITGPAAVQTSSATNVYVGGANGHLYQKACCFGSEGWTSWWDMSSPPGGSISSAPAAVNTGSATNVYVRGSNNHLYQKACCFGSEGWTSWWDMGASP